VFESVLRSDKREKTLNYAFFVIIECQGYLSRSCTIANLLFRPVVPKLRFEDPKGSGTSSQGIRGYISVITALKIAYLYN